MQKTSTTETFIHFRSVDDGDNDKVDEVDVESAKVKKKKTVSGVSIYQTPEELLMLTKMMRMVMK